MPSTEAIASKLLELQALDLRIERDKEAISSLPEIAEIAKKRKVLQKLKVESTKVLAQRKDLEMELSDLDDAELTAREEVDAVQADMGSSSDYRHIQDLERQLTDLAKRLDKIDYDRRDRKGRLDALLERGSQLERYAEQLGDDMKRDAARAREHAASLQADLDASQSTRSAIASGLPQDALGAYDAAQASFRGLGVEELQGSVPSICRTTLSSASLADLRRTPGLGTCPYCHRLIVVAGDAS